MPGSLSSRLRRRASPRARVADGRRLPGSIRLPFRIDGPPEAAVLVFVPVLVDLDAGCPQLLEHRVEVAHGS